MPSITFESGPLTQQVKQQLITRLTAISADITGIPKDFFLLSIRELPDENIAIGGKSVAQIKQELNKK